MSRAAFFDALASNAYLNSLGLVDDSEHPTIVHNWLLEERPSDTTPFIVLRWGSTPPPRNQDPDFVVKSPESVTVWVNWPKELSSDYNDLVKILDEIDSIARTLRDTAGSDGYTLSFVQIGERSDDLMDEGFHTIAKTGVYQIHSIKTYVPDEPPSPPPTEP